jgi:hypothetical protein
VLLHHRITDGMAMNHTFCNKHFRKELTWRC